MDRYRQGLRGLKIPIEPFVGRLDFNEKLLMGQEQELLGVRAGVDLGPLVGLRGYYWRGMNDDFDDTDRIQSFGGEAQFNLSSGQGAVPFVVAGVGKLDFNDGYFEADSLSQEDKTMLILGGGVAFNLSDRLRLQASARNYLFSEDDLDSVTGADQVFSNWMYSAGLHFSFGGTSTPVRRPAPDPSGFPPGADQVGSTTGSTTTAPEEALVSESGSATSAEQSGDADSATADSQKNAYQQYVLPNNTADGNRIIPIPVPHVGELYVRYGQPGGVSLQSITTRDESAGVAQQPSQSGMNDRDLLRQTLREELERLGVTGIKQPEPKPTVKEDISDNEMELIERRVVDKVSQRLEEVLLNSVEKEKQALRDAVEDLKKADAAQGDGSRDPNVIVVQGDSEGRWVAEDGQVVSTQPKEAYQWSLQDLAPYVGLSADEPNQFVIGTRANFGPVTRTSKFSLKPELVLGFGDGTTSYMLAANLQYDFGSLRDSGSFAPYFSVGAGFLGFSEAQDGRSKSEGVLNLAYGLNAQFGRQIYFLEHQGIDLYDLHRVNLGMRFLW